MSSNPLLASFTEDELNLADILLNLGEIIAISESQRTKLIWGCKRKRSVPDEGAPISRAPAPSPSVKKTQDKITTEIKPRRIQVKSEENCGKGRSATTSASPNNPLTFSFTESDEKNKHCVKRSSKKRSREHYMKKIEKLTHSGNVLREEIGKVTKHYNKLKTINSKLKAMKREVLKTCSRKEQPQMEIIISPRQNNFETHVYGMPHQQPLIGNDRTSHNYLNSFGPVTTQLPSSSKRHRSDKNVGRIPDLNLLADEEASGFEVGPSQPLDMNMVVADRRARFADARRLRKGKVKVKTMSARGIKTLTR